MTNRNQQRNGQFTHQDDNSYPSNNQLGGSGQGNQGGYGQQSAYQGNHGQFSGNYGRDSNYQGPQQHGNYETQGNARGYADNVNDRFGAGGQYNRDPNANFGDQSRHASGYNPRETNANNQWEPENSRGPRGYGHSQSYGGALGYQDETLRTPQGGQYNYDRFQGSAQGYNQGGYNQGNHYGQSPNQSFRQSPNQWHGGYDQDRFQGGYDNNHFSGGGQHHDPHYNQWRNEQIRNLDNDYNAWRDERYADFSNEFGEWRKSRKDKLHSAHGSDANKRSDSDAGNANHGSASTASKSK